MVDDRLIAFSSTFALLCAVILARVVFMRQPRRLVLAGEAARSDGQGAVSPHSPLACRARRGSEA